MRWAADSGNSPACLGISISSLDALRYNPVYKSHWDFIHYRASSDKSAPQTPSSLRTVLRRFLELKQY